MKVFNFLILFLIIHLNLFGEKMKETSVIPTPQKTEIKDGFFALNEKTNLVFKNFNEKADFIQNEFQSELKEKFSLLLKFPVGSIKVSGNTIMFADLNDFTSDKIYGKMILENGLLEKDESYLLDINSEKITVLANNSKGVFYGLMTLIQLVEINNKKIQIPNLLIVDYPTIPMRGISDDMSRNQVSTLNDLKRIVRFCARYKMNYYSPYMEDIIEIKKYPDIGLNRGRITQGEAKELVEYGKKYFVEIIPIFQMLGHMENLLIQPNYYNLADFPGSASFDLTNEKIYEFLDDCIKELSEVFPSKFFNAGLDESWDVGFGNSKTLKEKLGIGVIHANHYKKVNEILKKYGKTMMMYGDIIHNHPDIFELLPKDIVVIDWRYGVYDYEKIVKKYKDYGIPFYASPSVTNFNKIFPWIENSIVNIRDFTKISFKYGCNGFLNSNWGDNGGENLREFNWFGYAFGAECSWNLNSINVENFRKNFFNDFYNSNVDEFIAVYHLLSDIGMSSSQYELWRDPFLPKRENSLDNTMPVVLRAETIQLKADAALNFLSKFDKNKIRNKYHLAFLIFAAEQGRFLADKLLLIEDIKKSIDFQNGKLLETEKIKYSEKADIIIKRLENMKANYSELWKKTNKSDNLDMILKNKYDRQVLYWKEFKLKLKEEIITSNNKIKSNWIHHPGANPTEKDGNYIPQSIFVKNLILQDVPKISKIQLIGDSFAELYVNGELIGDVRARRTLSLFVEAQRIKIFDIKNHLRKGENEIKVIVKNYGINPTAKINVQIFIDNGKDNFKVYSDGSWLVSKIGEPYVNATILPDKGNINEPDFNNNRSSWIER